MSAAELASKEVKEARERTLETEYLSHRTDQSELYRKEIQEDLGIDTSNSWIYDDDDGVMSEPDMEPADM
jgi:hypothetical protein